MYRVREFSKEKLKNNKCRVHLWQISVMKRATPAVKYKAPAVAHVVQEPVVEYKPYMPVVATINFTWKHFEKICSQIAFTQKEWAQMLHLSERTLQRYAKDGRPFEGIYVDRILHIDELVQEGLKTFQSADALLQWLKATKTVMGQQFGFDALFYRQGIEALIHQIGRIRHGIVA